MSALLERIKQFIDYKHISIRKFEESVGFSNGAFSSQLKNKKTIGCDKLENILHIYPEISAEWLLTGEGDMLKIANDSEEQTSNTLCKECALLKTKDELIETQRKLIQSLENQMGIK